MSEIKAGDLVMVVRASRCCGRATAIGRVFRVVDVAASEACRCLSCDCVSVDAMALIDSVVGHPLYRLKKLDPPPVVEDWPAVEELTA